MHTLKTKGKSVYKFLVRLLGEYNTSLAETSRKFIIEKLSISKLGSSSDLHSSSIISTDEGPSLRIESFAVINRCFH